jgi:hypothetical protein
MRQEKLRWKKELEKILHTEETKAWQRSRERDIREGDRNTSYFFALANQRKRKKNISCLEDNGVTLDVNDSQFLQETVWERT